jgi:hypothetical protein
LLRVALQVPTGPKSVSFVERGRPQGVDDTRNREDHDPDKQRLGGGAAEGRLVHLSKGVQESPASEPSGDASAYALHSFANAGSGQEICATVDAGLPRRGVLRLATRAADHIEELLRRPLVISTAGEGLTTRCARATK